jgi:hypothetical protein
MSTLTDTPLRRCEDCEHDLGDTFRRLKHCPLWGQSRMDVSTYCASFIAKPSEDASAGMHWWNGISEAERARWLDLAWRRNSASAGRINYSHEDMPSAADAYAAFQAAGGAS